MGFFRFITFGHTSFLHKQVVIKILTYLGLILFTTSCILFTIQVGTQTIKVNELSSDGTSAGLYTLHTSSVVDDDAKAFFDDHEFVQHSFLRSELETYTMEKMEFELQTLSAPYFSETGAELVVGEWPKKEGEWVLDQVYAASFGENVQVGEKVIVKTDNGHQKEVKITGYYRDLYLNVPHAPTALTLGNVKNGFIMGVTNSEHIAEVSTEMREQFGYALHRNQIYQTSTLQQLTDSQALVPFYSLLIVLQLIALGYLCTKFVSIFRYERYLKTLRYLGMSPRRIRTYFSILFATFSIVSLSISVFVVYISFQAFGDQWSHLFGTSLYNRVQHIENQISIPIDYTFMILGGIVLAIFVATLLHVSKEVKQKNKRWLAGIVSILFLLFLPTVLYNQVDYPSFHNENKADIETHFYVMNSDQALTISSSSERDVQMIDDLAANLHDELAYLYLKELIGWRISTMEHGQESLYQSRVLVIEDKDWPEFLNQIDWSKSEWQELQRHDYPAVHINATRDNGLEAVQFEGSEVEVSYMNHGDNVDQETEFGESSEEERTFHVYSADTELGFDWDTIIIPASYAGDSVQSDTLASSYFLPTDLRIAEFEYIFHSQYAQAYPTLWYVSGIPHGTWTIATEHAEQQFNVIVILPILLTLCISLWLSFLTVFSKRGSEKVVLFLVTVGSFLTSWLGLTIFTDQVLPTLFSAVVTVAVFLVGIIAYTYHNKKTHVTI
ncbi:FtsX-like permease family protein [Shouchella sp. JSM 1781072]|uniref:FtsX-like permease family protein n=1 Tax=Shouchella sp. JSM 1781072 TaxID=3344581 RepID=UPI0035C0580B